MKKFLILLPRGPEDLVSAFLRKVWTAIVWNISLALPLSCALTAHYLYDVGDPAVLAVLVVLCASAGAALIRVRNRRALRRP